MLSLISFVLAAKNATWEPRADLVESYNSAVDDFNHQQIEEAQALLLDILKKQPDCGMAQKLYAMILLQQRSFKEALPKLEHLANDFPKDAEIWLLLSDATFALQDFNRSLEAAQKAIALAPNDIDYEITLQRAFLRLGHYDDALKALQSARNTQPEHDLDCLEAQIWIDQKKFDKANEKMPSCEQATNADLIQLARMNLATVSGHQADTTQAATELGADSITHSSRAIVLNEAGDFQGCIAELDAEIAQNPKAISPHLIRASCLSNAGRYDEARADLQTIFEADTWITVEQNGNMTGIVTHGSEEQFWASVKEGGLLLVKLEMLAGHTKEAVAVAKRMEDHFGAIDAVAAAKALSSPNHTWSMLEDAFKTWPDSALLMNVSAELLVDHPDGISPTLIAIIATKGSDFDRYNLGIYDYNSKKYPDCITHLSPLLNTPELRQKAIHLSYTCASAANDLPNLDRLLALSGDPASLAPGDVMYHAYLLTEANRNADARPLADLVCAHPTPQTQNNCSILTERLN